MTRLDEIRARLAAACGCETPCAASCPSWACARTLAGDDLAFLLVEVERLTGEATAERAAVVAWLRAEAAAGMATCLPSCDDDYRRSITMATDYERMDADSIEQGEHRRTS